MMRFVFSTLFLLYAVPLCGTAWAGDTADIQKNDVRHPRWVEVDRTTRAAIVDAWLALPEGTRPPFPVFRDAQLGLRGRTGDKR